MQRVVVLEAFLPEVDDSQAPVRLVDVHRRDHFVEREDVNLVPFGPPRNVLVRVSLFSELGAKKSGV